MTNRLATVVVSSRKEILSAVLTGGRCSNLYDLSVALGRRRHAYWTVWRALTIAAKMSCWNRGLLLPARLLGCGAASTGSTRLAEQSTGYRNHQRCAKLLIATTTRRSGRSETNSCWYGTAACPSAAVAFSFLSSLSCMVELGDCSPTPFLVVDSPKSPILGARWERPPAVRYA